MSGDFWIAVGMVLFAAWGGGLFWWSERDSRRLDREAAEHRAKLFAESAERRASLVREGAERRAAELREARERAAIEARIWTKLPGDDPIRQRTERPDPSLLPLGMLASDWEDEEIMERMFQIWLQG